MPRRESQQRADCCGAAPGAGAESDQVVHLQVPVADKAELAALRTGQRVLLTGVIYTARDAAHRRMVETIRAGGEPPIPLQNSFIYYAGPCPAPPGRVIGSIGPTTSSRMDSYAPLLIDRGLGGMIGKGTRSRGVIDAIAKHGCVYFAALGGQAAARAGWSARRS